MPAGAPFDIFPIAVISLGGLSFVVFGLLRLLRRNPERDWTRVEGRIHQSLIWLQTRGGRSGYTHVWRLKLVYSYEFGSRQYRNDRIRPVGGGPGWFFRSKAERYRKRYLYDQVVEVYVDPENPTHAVLEPQQQPLLGFRLLLFGLAIFCVARSAFARDRQYALTPRQSV
jgi:hypothetical protein